MSNLIIKEYLSHEIVFTDEGWINATQTAKNFGKDVRGYTRSEQYKGYLKTILKEQNYRLEDLIITYKGYTNELEQGTYINKIFENNFLVWLKKTTKTTELQKVYILRGGEYTKIGVASDIESRLKRLQTGNPFKLEVLFITDLIKNAPSLESFLLNKYKKKAMQGEWFKFSEEDIQNCIKYIHANKY